MAGQTIAEQCKRHGSQGGKVVTCHRCKTDVPEYAGRKIAAWRELYAHQPGRCADSQPGEGTLRGLADHPGLFAWRCAHIEPAGDLPLICNESGQDRADFTSHMRGHGATMIKPSVAPVRLRKGRPAAPKFAPVDVKPFKALRWTETHETRSGDLDSPYGIKVERWTSEHKGQLWSAGESAHSVWAIEDMRAAGQPNRLVQLYVHADGSVSRDWSAAASSRREANAAAKRAAERASRAA